eukprot:15468038-Alexandrium_andersonii.AAC.1
MGQLIYKLKQATFLGKLTAMLVGMVIGCCVARSCSQKVIVVHPDVYPSHAASPLLAQAEPAPEPRPCKAEGGGVHGEWAAASAVPRQLPGSRHVQMVVDEGR